MGITLPPRPRSPPSWYHLLRHPPTSPWWHRPHFLTSLHPPLLSELQRLHLHPRYQLTSLLCLG